MIAFEILIWYNKNAFVLSFVYTRFFRFSLFGVVTNSLILWIQRYLEYLTHDSGFKSITYTIYIWNYLLSHGSSIQKSFSD